VLRTQQIVQLSDTIEMDPGTPEPQVVATEDRVFVAYRISQPEISHREDIENTSDEIAVATFYNTRSHSFGAPNDEALHGHPLYHLGLTPYSFAEVLNSEWIESIRNENRIHPHHTDALFDALRHFIITFHDSTFEILAESYSVCMAPSSLHSDFYRLIRSLL
jgi:hypothetical protein